MKFDRNVVTSAFNLDNQLTSFEWGGEVPMSATPQYDDNGNMTFGPIAESQAGYFNYDARNRLTYAGGVTYSYDSENNRKTVTYTKDSSTITNTYIYDRSGSLPNVLIRNKTVSDGASGGSGNGTSVTNSTYYIHGAGLGYEVSFDSVGNEIDIKFYHYDQVGSTIALTDSAGTITDKFSYDIWGYSAHTEGTTDTPFLYVGLFGIQTDFSGLINMRARYYNPTTQSFITPDPMEFSGGINWYLYASGNPISRVDKNGYWDGSSSILRNMNSNALYRSSVNISHNSNSRVSHTSSSISSYSQPIYPQYSASGYLSSLVTATASSFTSVMHNEMKVLADTLKASPHVPFFETRKIQTYSGGFKVASNSLTVIGIGYDMYLYSDGEISEERFAYHMAGATITYAATKVNPLLGLAVGASFIIAEAIYDHFYSNEYGY